MTVVPGERAIVKPVIATTPVIATKPFVATAIVILSEAKDLRSGASTLAKRVASIASIASIASRAC